jgi:hypothetical protein
MGEVVALIQCLCKRELKLDVGCLIGTGKRRYQQLAVGLSRVFDVIERFG